MSESAAAMAPADPLACFSAPVAGWFRTAFGAPTPPQAHGWPVIARGEHALILSPTGSGKTLTAFLWSLDVLFQELLETPEPERRRASQRASRAGGRTRQNGDDVPVYEPGVRVVYVSPLKALNNDVERNLQVPLAGIRAHARAAGMDLPGVRVAVRTGDTPSSERQQMVRRPPHILITTPESLYLLLTSERARAMFATTHTLIVDEIHTVVGSKRGAHLAVSLERLQRLTTRSLQRIGLSATVRPLETAARFLGGQEPSAQAQMGNGRVAHVGAEQTHTELPFAPRPVTVVDAGYRKPLDLEVVTVTDDFRNLPGNGIWSAVIPEITKLVETHRTTLVFCNSRRLAERTADRLNERRLFEKMSGGNGAAANGAPLLAAPPPKSGNLGMFAAGVEASALEAAGLQPIRAHHGSMSKEARLDMEAALKAGTLPALVATSSLELGIDIGEIDLVVQVQSPKSVSSGLQRVGRSGHLVGQTSVGRIFTTHPEDVVEAAAVAHGMLHGEIEETHTPENPLDILAQHLMAMVATEDWDYQGAYELVRGAYPFRNLTTSSFQGVVEMLSGKYPERVSRHLQARLSWDRVNNRLAALPSSRLLAIQSGGTIPDRGQYTLVLSDRRTRVGELDEEFVFESRTGDTFLLGSQVWRIQDITDDRVIAEPAPGEVPRMPFWRGDYPWRPYDLGKRIGAFRRTLVDRLAAFSPADVELVRDLSPKSEVRSPKSEAELGVGSGSGAQPQEGARRSLATTHSPFLPRKGEKGLGDERVIPPHVADLLRFLDEECALDRHSIVQIVNHIAGQLEAAGHVATDRAIVVEVFDDAVGDPRMVVHSPFGGRVNGPWGIVLAGLMRERLGVEPQMISGDDGILFRFTNADVLPPADLVQSLTSKEATERLLGELPNSAVFVGQFRMNAARALLLPRQRAGKRTPLWLSRLKAKDLLQSVQQFDDFPIILETFRDCLRDVMDLDGLAEVLDQIQRGEIQVVVHEAEFPSPVAMGLDYRFAMQYVYEYDAPRGEKQLAALSLNRGLLADLLQDGSLAELLKPEAVAEVTARVTHTGAETRARSAEELAQLLYELGDLSEPEIAARSAGDAYRAWLQELAGAGRIVPHTFGGGRRWVHAERLHEYAQLAEQPLPVLRRWLMHAGPTRAEALAARYGLPEGQVQQHLAALGDEVVSGRFIHDGAEQWLDRRNLEQMHRRTLTLLRKEVQPVPVSSYAAFLRRWQHVNQSEVRSRDLTRGPLRGLPAFPEGKGSSGLPTFADHQAPPTLGEGPGAARGRGDDFGLWTQDSGLDLSRVLQQLRGFAVLGVAWERDVLPVRLPSFDPALLAERCQSGELMWVAEGGRDARRARVRFVFRGEGGLFLERRPEESVLEALSPPARAVYDYLAEEGAALLADVAEGAELAREAAQQALIELVLAGLVTNDTLAALHAVLGYTPPPAARPAQRSSLEAQLAVLRPERPERWTRDRLRDARRRAREAAYVATAAQAARASRAAGVASGWVGRWSLVHRPSLLGKPLPEGERALRQTRQLLARWGVVTKAALEREGPSLRWEAIYPVLAYLETRGDVRRGYFVEGLPGVQFALPEVVEQLRAVNGQIERLREGAAGAPPDVDDLAGVTVLSAVDPAQLFGAENLGGALRFPRTAGTAVAALYGEPVAVLDEGGGAIDAVPEHPTLVAALRALARWWAPRVGGRIKVERWNDLPVLESDGLLALEAAGFAREGGTMLWVEPVQ